MGAYRPPEPRLHTLFPDTPIKSCWWGWAVAAVPPTRAPSPGPELVGGAASGPCWMQWCLSFQDGLGPRL